MRSFQTLSLVILLTWATIFTGMVNPAPFPMNSKTEYEHQDNVLRFVSEDNEHSHKSAYVLRGQNRLSASDGHSKQSLAAVNKLNNGNSNQNHRASQASRFGGLFDEIDCDFCKFLVPLLQDMVARNASHTDIEDTFVEICSLFKIETKRVCAGLAKMFQVEFFTVLQQLILSPEEVCGVLVDNCGKPYDPYDSWNVSFPSIPQPPPVSPKLPKKGLPTLRVLHLTDIHIDLLYKVGSIADCGEPLCCREGNGSTNGAWKFGDYRHCDTPPWTLENLFSHLAAQNDSFDYIFWTGDIPGHNVWNQTRNEQLEVISYAVNLLLKYFPGKPIYPSLGNHESSPVNSFPPSYIKGSNSISWLYDALADHWSHWLPKDAIDTVRSGAYYTVSPFPGFRIISLNMNYCNNENWWMLLNMTDPNGELHWLIQTLQAAEDKKEKVHIIGHIPPGISDCLKGWSWNFYKVVSRYQNTIAGQFYGHTHYDSFAVFYDVETLKRPINVAYVGPSVTPYDGQNMGYRFYTIDGHYNGSSYEVLDHDTYYLNLTKANLEGKITWEFEYSAKATYNLTSLFPADWDNLIEVMKTNQMLMDLYDRYHEKSRYTGTCDITCRKGLLCDARSGRSHDPSLCKDL